VARVPEGAPETGGGATSDDADRSATLLVLGGLGLAGAGTAVVLRRRTDPTRAGRG
jgi:MYXO-CTERM domain-containing protein